MNWAERQTSVRTLSVLSVWLCHSVSLNLSELLNQISKRTGDKETRTGPQNTVILWVVMRLRFDL